MFVEVEGHARVYAMADEDLGRERDAKTSAVHFVCFEFTPRISPSRRKHETFWRVTCVKRR